MDFFINKGRFLIAEFPSLKDMLEYHRNMPRKLMAEVRLNDLSGAFPRYAEGIDIAYGDPFAWKVAKIKSLERRNV